MLSIKKLPRYAAAVIITDIIVVIFSYVIAYHTRFSEIFFPPHLITPSFEAYIKAIIVVVPVYLTIFRSYNLYKPERHIRRIYELLNVIKAVSMATVFLMALTFAYREFSYSRIVLVFAWFYTCLFCCISRYALIQVEYFIRREKVRENVLIVGTNRNSRSLIQWAKENPHYGQDVIGILTNRGAEEGKHVDGIPILGELSDLDEVISMQKIDAVVLSEPNVTREQVTELMMKCESKMIGFKLVADFYGLLTHHVDIEYVSNVPLLGLKSLPLDDPWNRVMKRFFDFMISGVMIIIVSPLFFFVAIAIKVSDRGPVFYRQERIGQDGKGFNIYKFRTMNVEAERTTGPVWAKPNDHRVTLLGRFLRKTNLDEFPQLWNVLTGEMSLVGPRPERPYFVEQFRDQIPRYMARHKIKSGLTGWAQIHGLRGNTSLEERIKYDLYYMENWTIMMDIEILFATLFAFKNAY